MTTVLPVGDLHCGHKIGLTPPRWQNKPSWQKDQDRLWRIFNDGLDKVGSVDTLILNGDLIDGNGYRLGGIENVTVDWDEMCEMATDVINHIGAKNIHITYGTPSHVSNNGTLEEAKIAKAVGASIDSHLFLEVEDVVFDVKHKIGSSGIPHGRVSALMKALLWNREQATVKMQPKADLLLRSHVHYHVFCGDSCAMGMTLPALQGPGSKYGKEQCEGLVDFGLVWFNVQEGSFEWDSHTTRSVNGAVVRKD